MTIIPTYFMFNYDGNQILGNFMQQYKDYKILICAFVEVDDFAIFEVETHTGKRTMFGHLPREYKVFARQRIYCTRCFNVCLL